MYPIVSISLKERKFHKISEQSHLRFDVNGAKVRDPGPVDYRRVTTGIRINRCSYNQNIGFFRLKRASELKLVMKTARIIIPN